MNTAPRAPSLAGATGSMAVATLVSRLSGFAGKLLLAWVIGFGVLNDSYTVANTLPNIVYELLLGGVLTSVVVPLLVRAARDDADGGLAYTQRLVTVAGVLLGGATVLAVAAAPALTRIYLGDGDAANPQLATAFAYLLLPEIVFYGLGALFGAILNARSVFGPAAWAPVVNNLVVIATLGGYTLVPGEISLDPVRMGDAKLLVLGIGTTLGIAAQAAVLIPPLRRVGFRFRWRWGWDPRLSQAGLLVLWVVGYVLVSQVGYIATTRAAAQGAPGGVAIYSYAWMLFQLPYGVLGVSLLTAIMPRMSRAAAEGDTARVVDDLSLGSRYSTVLLVPVAVVLTVAGESIGIALFSFGAAGTADASRLGLALAFSAFGLLPYAITMLQLRVFYAMADARTPTLIMVVMTAVKVPLLLACPAVLDPADVVLGLAFVNAASFVVGAVVGQVWLHLRLGRVRTMSVLVTVGKTLLAAIPAAAAAVGIRAVVGVEGAAGAWLDLTLSALVVGIVMGGILLLLRTAELRPLLTRLAHRS
ncbi:MAG: murein biosynthesis integral membrane protein MurJ [Actinomycetota bacterium]|nr:murein biosynthesis integral membrane protein MurJ [Actinomycetota bacterium]